jgi:hypothetical protein
MICGPAENGAPIVFTDLNMVAIVAVRGKERKGKRFPLEQKTVKAKKREAFLKLGQR